MEEKKKKKELKKVPREIIPVGEDNWILQPIAISMMRYDYDTVQTRALVSMMKKMQTAIKEVVYRHAKPEEQLSLFANQDFIGKFGNEEINPDREIVLKLPLSSFSYDKRKYNVLKESIRQLVSIPVEIPIRSLDDEVYTKIAHLCEAYVPEEKYAKCVYLKLDKKVAIRFISGDAGTHKYLDRVIFKAKSKYTQRIYLFISAWKNHGATCERSVQWIRKWLRLEDAHRRWNMFYTRVLKKAEDELRQLAENGESDIYFTTDTIDNQPGKQGEPDKIRFIIHRAIPDEMSESEDLKRWKSDIATFCNERFGIKGMDLNSIVNAVTEENAARMMDYLNGLYTREQKAFKEGKIDNLHRHAYTCIMNELKDWQVIEQQQATLLTVRVPKEDGTGQNQAPAENKDTLSEKERNTWNNILDAIQGTTSDQNFETWFQPDVLSLQEISGNTIKIKVPSRAFVETFNNVNNNGELLQQAVRSVLGQDAKVIYIAKE